MAFIISHYTAFIIIGDTILDANDARKRMFGYNEHIQINNDSYKEGELKMQKGASKAMQYEGTAMVGSGTMNCEPIDCPTIGVRQPLIECMIETSSELEEVESLLGRLNGILFGGYPVEDENKEKEGITSIEEQSHDAKYRTVRIRRELEEIIGRLAD